MRILVRCPRVRRDRFLPPDTDVPLAHLLTSFRHPHDFGWSYLQSMSRLQGFNNHVHSDSRWRTRSRHQILPPGGLSKATANFPNVEARVEQIDGLGLPDLDYSHLLGALGGIFQAAVRSMSVFCSDSCLSRSLTGQFLLFIFCRLCTHGSFADLQSRACSRLLSLAKIVIRACHFHSLDRHHQYRHLRPHTHHHHHCHSSLLHQLHGTLAPYGTRPLRLLGTGNSLLRVK